MENDKRVRQLELLPHAEFIIEVTQKLEKWQGELREAIPKLRSAANFGDEAGYKSIAELGRKCPKSLIEKSLQDELPTWLSGIYIAGARYYRDCVASMPDLWDDNCAKGNANLASHLIDCCNESVFHISGLLSYIKDAVPNSILECPVDLGDEDFLIG